MVAGHVDLLQHVALLQALGTAELVVAGVQKAEAGQGLAAIEGLEVVVVQVQPREVGGECQPLHGRDIVLVGVQPLQVHQRPHALEVLQVVGGGINPPEVRHCLDAFKGPQLVLANSQAHQTWVPVQIGQLVNVIAVVVQVRDSVVVAVVPPVRLLPFRVAEVGSHLWIGVVGLCRGDGGPVWLRGQHWANVLRGVGWGLVVLWDPIIERRRLLLLWLLVWRCGLPCRGRLLPGRLPVKRRGWVVQIGLRHLLILVCRLRLHWGPYHDPPRRVLRQNGWLILCFVWCRL
mmetsp:Transcript_96146/g.161600  ORF Transcript_96146/g.161600 Transcript_96146/m.161600 type:complete len:289 (-) Transcript_96146:199-1065(-)